MPQSTFKKINFHYYHFMLKYISVMKKKVLVVNAQNYIIILDSWISSQTFFNYQFVFNFLTSKLYYIGFGVIIMAKCVVLNSFEQPTNLQKLKILKEIKYKL